MQIKFKKNVLSQNSIRLWSSNVALQRPGDNCIMRKLSMRDTLIPVRCKRSLGAACLSQPPQQSPRYCGAGKSILCITVMNHLSPSLVMTKFNNPFLSGMS